jgi:two-component system LytT family response regulator
MIKALIIEDEIRSRKALENSLNNYCETVQVMGHAETVSDSLLSIKELNPDLLFVDIDLPDGTGFEIFEHLPKPWPKVIFVTAYNQYAVNAFQISAIDYLLKPIDPDLLQKAVQKVTESDDTEEQQENRMNAFAENRQSGKLKKMVVPTTNGLQLVRIEEIVRLQANGNYTTIHLKNKSTILVSKKIKEYESVLDTLGFFRVHQSHIINLDLVEQYIKGEGGTVVLEDGDEIEVARRRKDAFIHRITKGF